MDNENILAVLPLLRREFDAALAKHPFFPSHAPDMMCIIAEEFGELAKEINDRRPGWRARALLEVTHVAVTSLRTMKVLQDEILTGNQG